jgi:YVTN family beta-propeller protein
VTGVVNGRVAYDYDDELEFTLIPGEEPEHGTVEFNPDGRFVYTPNLDDPIPAGTTDSFTVQITEATTDHAHPAGEAHALTVEVNNFEVAPHNTVVDTIPTGPDATLAVVTPDGSRVYIGVGGSDHVRVIDTATNDDIPVTDALGHTIAGIPVGDGPTRMAMNCNGTRLYVMNFDDTVSVIDTNPGTIASPNPDSNKVITTINLDVPPSGIGPGAEDIAVSPDDRGSTPPTSSPRTFQ